jgi:hypothetical protein
MMKVPPRSMESFNDLSSGTSSPHFICVDSMLLEIEGKESNRMFNSIATGMRSEQYRLFLPILKRFATATPPKFKSSFLDELMVMSCPVLVMAKFLHGVELLTRN